MDEANARPSLCRLEGDRHGRGARWRSSEPSQPKVKTIRLPGSISVMVPEAVCPGMMVHRYSPPALSSTRAVTACQRRSRSGSVKRAKVVVRVEGHEHRLLRCHVCVSTFRRPGAGELFELMGPKDFEGVAQCGHAHRVEPVVAEPARLASLDQPCIGQHPQMLRDGRAA